MKKPFLWDYVKKIEDFEYATGGEERPLTASANEENKSALIELVEKD